MKTIKFPPADHPLFPIIDPAHVKNCVEGLVEFPTLSGLKAQGRRNTEPNMPRIYSMCLLGNDSVALVSVGKRGAHKVEWRFTRGVPK